MARVVIPKRNADDPQGDREARRKEEEEERERVGAALRYERIQARKDAEDKEYALLNPKKHKREPQKGDWECPTCGWDNYARNKVCYKRECDEPRPLTKAQRKRRREKLEEEEREADKKRRKLEKKEAKKEKKEAKKRKKEKKDKKEKKAKKEKKEKKEKRVAEEGALVPASEAVKTDEKAPSSDDDFGPAPAPQGAAGGVDYGKGLLAGEGEAMAEFAQADQRIPRRGEIGYTMENIEGFENMGFVMSGARHGRMNAVRQRKEAQVYSAEEKRAQLQKAKEDRMQKEKDTLQSLRALLEAKGLRDEATK
eukprot:TRINITY_DN1717_c0_g1_i2.p1 TRINITY_DN1717_c0_g1~~TRINITY_DN1717_c0_g1_i2.p1  ORF type:complete len:362 (+),score=222.85 TRINITY_DN1717_c0_g1_i2:157-1086(+)